MIIASVVLYKSDKEELRTVVGCMDESSIEKIILVDNSPSDELREFVSGLSSKLEYIYGQGNVGYGSAHNIAIRKSIELGATYHVVINPDIFFEKGVIEELSEFMDRNSDVGQVMPQVYYPNGEIQKLCKLLPTPLDLIGRKFLPKSFTKKRNDKFELQFTNYDKVMNVPFLSGCFMFLRVDALEKTNGFDDNIFMYCEDIDLCRRIKDAGYRTMFYPKVSVVHHHKQESYTNKTMLKVHIKSALYYFNKWGWFFDKERRKYNQATIKDINSQYESIKSN